MRNDFWGGDENGSEIEIIALRAKKKAYSEVRSKPF
jgi:hypothetical protein